MRVPADMYAKSLKFYAVIDRKSLFRRLGYSHKEVVLENGVVEYGF